MSLFTIFRLPLGQGLIQQKHCLPCRQRAKFNIWCQLHVSSDIVWCLHIPKQTVQSPVNTHVNTANKCDPCMQTLQLKKKSTLYSITNQACMSSMILINSLQQQKEGREESLSYQINVHSTTLYLQFALVSQGNLNIIQKLNSQYPE